MRGVLLFLPILHLAAGQSTVTASPTINGPLVSSDLPIATSISATPSAFDPSKYSELFGTLPSSVSGISVYSGLSEFTSDGGHVATTTVDFSIITTNGSVVTLTATPSGPVDTVSPSIVDFTSGTTSTRTTGSGTGTATGTQSLIGTFTNAAPAADSAKLGLGFLGFAGAVVAVGL